MIVTLIPLYLAASIGVSENYWKYGPEVIYDARVDSTSHPPGQYEGIISIANMTTKLKCRSKSRFAQICNFYEPKYVISAIRPSGKAKIVKIPKLKEENNIGEDIFELNYGSNGLESITVSSSIKLPKLDMIRALVGQLNLAGDFPPISDDREFKNLENFTTGSCQTNHVVSVRGPSDDDEDKEHNNSYEILTLIGVAPGQVWEILRTRNLDNCRYRINYFFGSRDDQGIEFDTKIKSSKSLVTLRNGYFTSWTENAIIVGSKLLPINTSLTERITLRLEKIVPASDRLPTIVDPLTTSIHPGRWLQDDKSDVKKDFN